MSGCDREFNFVEEQAGAKSHVCVRLKTFQYVNGSTDRDAGADCRMILRFVIFSYLYLSKSVYGVFICK